jgi:hypothetical protein
MSNYSKTTDFAAKDALTTGNANKIVKGTEIDDEFDAIQTAVNSKADTNNSALTGTPTAPTADAATNTTQIATTAFVQAQKASPALTGTPTAPTADAATDTTQIATTAFVQAAAALLYPVGSIYSNVAVATNPATLLGFGTWTAFGAGRVMVGLDGDDEDFDTVGETGGAKTHTLTISEMSAHTHTYVEDYGTMLHMGQMQRVLAKDGTRSKGYWLHWWCHSAQQLTTIYRGLHVAAHSLIAG